MSTYRLKHLIDRIRTPLFGAPHRIARARQSAASEIARLPKALRDDLGYALEWAPVEGYIDSASFGVIASMHQQK